MHINTSPSLTEPLRNRRHTGDTVAPLRALARLEALLASAPRHVSSALSTVVFQSLRAASHLRPKKKLNAASVDVSRYTSKVQLPIQRGPHTFKSSHGKFSCRR